jgi:hypothetical protein
MVYNLDLFKETDGNDRFVAVAQNQDDAATLEKLCARDRKRQCTMEWVGPMKLAFTAKNRDSQQGREENNDLAVMTRAQLEQTATELGLVWQKNWSTESAIEKIRSSRLQKEHAVASAPK